eukprot:6223411-Lingulodinium_polyedra.AAC.1
MCIRDRPFEDYPVTARCVSQLVQARKISYANARRELIKTGEDLARKLPDLETVSYTHLTLPTICSV